MGREKNPRAKRKKRKKARAGRLGPGLKHHLGAIDLDVVFGVKIYGTKVPANSPSRLRRAQDLDAKIYGAETCKLSVTNDDTEIRVHILKAYLQKHIREKNLKKRLKTKKIRAAVSCVINKQTKSASKPKENAW